MSTKLTDIRTIEGTATAAGLRFALVVSKFNDFVTARAGNGLYEPSFATAFRETGRTLLEEALRLGDETVPVALPREPIAVGGAA
jgi:hypothetical protein